jgi:hypothetical protein
MPSTSEKGHAKNVDNLSKLIEVCKGFGAKYNPSKTAIKIANLSAKHATNKQELQDIKDTAQAETNARNNRAIGFKDRNKFSTRILAAIKSSDATPETITNAISINKKIQGERITKDKKVKPAADGTAEGASNTNSTSQLSYTNIVDHYRKYSTMLTSIADVYAPNEVELQIDSINTYIKNLETFNNTVDTAETAASNALIARDKGFYDTKTGIPDTAQDVKDYVKSVYGAGSPEHKLVTKITFSRPTKK